jgi:hypothetical protein
MQTSHSIHRTGMARVRGSHLVAANEPLTAADRALAESFAGRVPFTVPVAFRVDGVRTSLDALLHANGDDPDFCTWACAAKPGDVFRDGAGCECVADRGAQ